MTQTTDIVLTHSADGLAVVLLPEHGLGENSLATTREKLISFADDVGAGELRLDFSQIEYLGSAGLGVLVSLHRRLAQKDGHLALDNLAPDLVKLFRLTRLDTILDIRPAAAESL
jgi:anti-anti-sigma factor